MLFVWWFIVFGLVFVIEVLVLFILYIICEWNGIIEGLLEDGILFVLLKELMVEKLVWLL